MMLCFSRIIICEVIDLADISFESFIEVLVDLFGDIVGSETTVGDILSQGGIEDYMIVDALYDNFNVSSDRGSVTSYLDESRTLWEVYCFIF